MAEETENTDLAPEAAGGAEPIASEAPVDAVAAPSAAPSGERSMGYARRPPGGKRFPRRKVCAFCADKIDYIDYKDIKRIRKFMSDRGKILPRRITGNCAAHQRMVTTALKRARVIALVPFRTE